MNLQKNNTDSLTLEQTIDEKLFSLLVANVKDYAIYMIDPNGYILSWNQGAANIKGYQENEVIGRHISIFYTGKDNEKNIPGQNMNKALKNGSYECEGWRLRKDGSLFWASAVFTTVYDEKGHLAGFAKITRDITDRKKKEDSNEAINAELERRVKENTKKIINGELRFRKLIENSYEGITLFDRELNVVYRSMSAEDITGWSNTLREKFEISDLVHPDDQMLVKKLLEEVFSSPAVPILSTYRIKHKKGHYIWVECYFTNLLDDKNIAAIVCNFRDITAKKNADEEKKRADQEREKITADLVRRNKDLEQFTYIISHNLRAPVANIKGLSDLLNCFDHADPECTDTLTALSTSVKNLDKVIMDLNHILQTGKQGNEKNELVFLPDLVDEITSELQPMIQCNNATIDFNFKEIDTLYTLKGFVYSVFQNLITNSIKYRNPDLDPIISIVSSLRDERTVIRFRDNGKGIDMQKNGGQLFGLYKRFDHTVEGKGMGLYMVKMQVESLGGNIEVESEPGRGTEFVIELPTGTLPD
ncbi:MAG TPA: PAS domain-containing sensor histidine kinase [Mucilaginibacter sp.]|nr:PAS domain-containing sensor histidine kinase [Mucilaginibacter sp.]